FACFFFQAEAGIRDGHVTGVQTCALPICSSSSRLGAPPVPMINREVNVSPAIVSGSAPTSGTGPASTSSVVIASSSCDRDEHLRSEERRVGKECGVRFEPYYVLTTGDHA